jgi:MATE family multidrug resistance protein
MVSMGILSIISIRISHARATNNREDVTRYVHQGFLLAGLLSIPAVLFCIFSRELFTLAHQDSVVIELGPQYLHASIGLILPVLLFTVLRNFMSALEQAKITFYILFASIFLNGALNYIFVFGKWGIPALGVAGAGYGSSIVCTLLCIALMIIVYQKSEMKEYGIFNKKPQLHQSTLTTLLKLGLPIGVIVLMENGFFTAINILAGLFGSTALAASQIIYYLLGVCAVTSYGIGEATGIRIAQHLGKQSPDQSRLSAGIGLMLGALCMSFFSLWIYFHPVSLIAVFIDTDAPENQDVIILAKQFLRIGAFFILFDSMQAICMRALRGYSDTFIPMWISIGGFWLVGLGASTLFAFYWQWGVVSLWWGLALGLFFTATILIWRLNKQSLQALTP